MSLHAACVPPLTRALMRLSATLDRAAADLGPRMAGALFQRPADGMLPAGQQAATAIQFSLRIAYPLIGARPPELRGPLDADGLSARAAEAMRLLTTLDPAAFAGAETRMIRFQAGFADLELPGAGYLHDFGLPSFYFHLAMAHVALKQAGAGLGKADFDGLHVYPAGFSLN